MSLVFTKGRDTDYLLTCAPSIVESVLPQESYPLNPRAAIGLTRFSNSYTNWDTDIALNILCWAQYFFMERGTMNECCKRLINQTLENRLQKTGSEEYPTFPCPAQICAWHYWQHCLKSPWQLEVNKAKPEQRELQKYLATVTSSDCKV